MDVEPDSEYLRFARQDTLPEPMRRLSRGPVAGLAAAVPFAAIFDRTHCRATVHGDPPGDWTNARVPQHPPRGPRFVGRISIERWEQGGNQSDGGYGPQVSLHRISQVPGSRWLPRGRASLGDS